jgi:hypothetical protein
VAGYPSAERSLERTRQTSEPAKFNSPSWPGHLQKKNANILKSEGLDRVLYRITDAGKKIDQSFISVTARSGH